VTDQNLTEGGLSAAQATQYWDEGYLCPIDVLTPEAASDYRARLEQVERDLS